ncbi:polysaccharide deacetylase family protein [Brevibacillus daliensis]|uniref:polysaccharide deacetylase family protein n=1 Tax=Brevibacillus daliensis TaxID=2892995 RepID=UPI001E3C9DD5|nr:polysaccharide deacetylase family protein [Brevibacillus daliensis]
MKNNPVWIVVVVFITALLATGIFLYISSNKSENMQNLQQENFWNTTLGRESSQNANENGMVNSGEYPDTKMNKDANSSKTDTLPGSKQDASVPSKEWYKNKVVILNYHHINQDSSQAYAMTSDRLREHLTFLRENGFHVISMDEFIRFMETKHISTPNAVLLTFDDGYESYYTEAYPLLRQFGYPSTNFVITSRLRDSLDRKRENMTTPLTHQQIEEMLDSGLVSIGSHTYSLHHQEATNEWGQPKAGTEPVFLEDLYRVENEGEYRDRLYVDFMMSRVALEDLLDQGAKVISMPLGFTSNIVIESAKEAGYQYAFTSRPGTVGPNENPYAIPRIDVGKKEIGAAQLHELFTKVKLEE